MSWLRLSEIAAMLGQPLVGEDAWVDSVSTDTRARAGNELFFALEGPRFDAHAVLEQSGAPDYAGLVVTRSVNHRAPQIIVADTRVALGQFGAAWRKQFSGRVVGLTGSNGKTTVKEMIASILAVEHDVLYTQGNLNNEIGVPLTLLRLRPRHEIAVIEMGANHPGEIGYLTQLVRPDVALVNNAGPAHLEGFGDLDGVARAKGEIYAGLGSDGVAVINADDPYAAYWASLNENRRVVRFGATSAAEVCLVDLDPLRLRLGDSEIELALQLEGRHNALNATAAAAVAYALGVANATVREGLARMTAFKGRLRAVRGLNGVRVIDDSYNANPASAKAAVDVLAQRPGVRILVLGDMGELGIAAEALHGEVGRYAKARGLERFFGFGPLSKAAVDAFGAGGAHFAELDLLLDVLKSLASPEVVALVKGSRSMRMDRVVEALKARVNIDATDGNGGRENVA
ncbi:MAG: UDP-N-acetylmuramoyl-tripeptide--D-alanyl-D-alanine ligase [Thiotrichales bacterium]